MHPRLMNKPDLETAKRVVCALIAESGGEFHGKVRLNKGFWRAHVHYYKNHRGLLSKYPIARLPEGPAIDDVDDLLVELERDGRIELSQREIPGYSEPEAIYVLKGDPPDLNADSLDSVRHAMQWLGGRTGSAVSNESHRLSRGWKSCENGDIIDIAFDALSQEEYNAMEADIQAIDASIAQSRGLLGAIFGR